MRRKTSYYAAAGISSGLAGSESGLSLEWTIRESAMMLPMRERKLLAGIAATALALIGCEGQPSAQDATSAAYVSREPLKHGSSIHDPRPLESVTGELRFLGECWVVSSGPNGTALFFPDETRLVIGELHVGTQRLREGQSYKFVGDLAETGADGQRTCNGLSSSMGVGAAWPQSDQL